MVGLGKKNTQKNRNRNLKTNWVNIISQSTQGQWTIQQQDTSWNYMEHHNSDPAWGIDDIPLYIKRRRWAKASEKKKFAGYKTPRSEQKTDLNPFFGSQPFTFTCVVYHAEEWRTPGDDCLTLQPKVMWVSLSCYYCLIQRVPSRKENISAIN